MDVFDIAPGEGMHTWQPVGGYAVVFAFSDGHRTGIFSHAYLRGIGARIGADESAAG